MNQSSTKAGSKKNIENVNLKTKTAFPDTVAVVLTNNNGGYYGVLNKAGAVGLQKRLVTKNNPGTICGHFLRNL